MTLKDSVRRFPSVHQSIISTDLPKWSAGRGPASRGKSDATYRFMLPQMQLIIDSQTAGPPLRFQITPNGSAQYQ